jgi:hypothetical protein
MKYLLLVCWDKERMDAQTEPDRSAAPETEEEPFPWVDDLEVRGIRLTGDQLAPPRRARSVRVPRRQEAGDRRSVRRMPSAASTCSSAGALRRRSNRRRSPGRPDGDDRGTAAVG